MKRLVDILARELAEWPKESAKAMQDFDKEIRFFDSVGDQMASFDFYAEELACDACDEKTFAGGGTEVTRAEWQAAVDALNADKCEHSYANNIGCPECGELNAPKVVEWDGVSLPPKGTAVEVRFACEKIGSEWPWHSGVVVASGPQPEGGVMVAVEANGFTVALRVTSDFIRPARTAEQVAAEERNKAVDELVELFINHYEYPKGAEQYLPICRAIHDAGYRKEPKPCGS